MTHTLTLVASGKPLTDQFLRSLKPVLGAYNIEVGKPAWLAPDKAADIAISLKPQTACIIHLREECAPHKIDFFVNKTEGRRKKLVLADMDSTIIAEETLDELAAHAGIKDQIAAITTRAMNGELDFETALRERVALLKGLPETALQETLDKMVVNPGAQAFIQTMRDNGATCILVSGGFTFFTSRVASAVGFNGDHGNTLDIENGVLKGTVGLPILDKFAKLEFLKHYCGELGLTMQDALTIGDGANDLPMLKAAGLGIGYYPKKAVVDELDNLILYGDFTAALYAQGLQS